MAKKISYERISRYGDSVEGVLTLIVHKFSGKEVMWCVAANLLTKKEVDHINKYRAGSINRNTYKNDCDTWWVKLEKEVSDKE